MRPFARLYFRFLMTSRGSGLKMQVVKAGDGGEAFVRCGERLHLVQSSAEWAWCALKKEAEKAAVCRPMLK
ncbi:hypothetical protein [Alloprevotella tannerae]|uniref:hypothetical protein n=1 Tax=Alloprevotella tannerae TaxID=76122 RepID=UPI0028D5ECF9|nr:hypothetical protein [Alloprevotella tannerae]